MIGRLDELREPLTPARLASYAGLAPADGQSAEVPVRGAATKAAGQGAFDPNAGVERSNKR